MAALVGNIVRPAPAVLLDDWLELVLGLFDDWLQRHGVVLRVSKVNEFFSAGPSLVNSKVISSYDGTHNIHSIQYTQYTQCTQYTQ